MAGYSSITGKRMKGLKVYKKKTYRRRAPKLRKVKRGKMKLFVGMPNEYRCILKSTYQGDGTLALTGGIYQIAVVNSAYSPMVALLNSVTAFKDFPRLCGATQSTTPYGRYRVNAIKATCRLMQNSITHHEIQGAPFQTSNAFGSYTWYSKLEDLAGGKKTAMYNNNDIKARSLTVYNTIAKATAGNTKDEDYSGVYNGDPAKLWGIQFLIRGSDIAQTGTFWLEIDLEYDTTFYSKNQHANSTSLSN